MSNPPDRTITRSTTPDDRMVQRPASGRLGTSPGQGFFTSQRVASLPKTEATQGKATERDVLIYASGVDPKIASLYASEMSGIGMQSSDLSPHYAENRSDFVELLKSYQNIHKLVLLSHASILGPKFKDGTLSWNEPLKLLGKNSTNQQLPKITEIFFEGCNIAKASEEQLNTFGHQFHTDRIRAWDKFHMLGYLSLKRGHVTPLKGQNLPLKHVLKIYAPYVKTSSKYRFEEFRSGSLDQVEILIEWFLDSPSATWPHEVAESKRRQLFSPSAGIKVFLTTALSK